MDEDHGPVFILEKQVVQPRGLVFFLAFPGKVRVR